MPVADKNDDHDVIHDLDQDSNRDREKGGKSKGSSKPKDLSHVPCKFFRVGSCTAGSSCPFSHSILEPGQHKDTCAWFVKGNCKFGHKCALAHILPGQSMAMDRKNKKAAQAANSASREGGKGGKSKGGHGRGEGGQGRNPLLSGSTAPTRILHGSTRAPIPMALKATISPSAPAPPLQDSDFAAFGMPDESTKLPTAPAQRKSSTSASNEEPGASDSPSQFEGSPGKDLGVPSTSSPSPLPASTPSAPRRINDSANSADLGPIGSPRSVSSSHDQSGRVNGFSPGTSPARAPGFLSSSPFSAPGTQSVFFSSESPDNFKARSGIAASLGAQHTWRDNFGRLPSGGAHESVGDIVVEDEDLEEFIPGSLSDLLTPEERSRRYSRTNATNAATNLGPGMSSPREGGWGAGPRLSVESHHHRYSRSVPAPSLLGDIKSIWSDNGQGLAGSPRSSAMEHTASAGPIGSMVSGTPASHKSGSAFGGRSFVDDHINSFLSPSNASAAFLPGTHQHYLNSKGAMQRTPSGGLRPGAYAPTSTTNIPGANAANLLARLNEPLPPQPHTAGHQRQQFDGTSESFNGQPFHLGRPIPQGKDFGGDMEDRNALSPSALALQSHAPGQSLPQGLAAGYSRIHALPPPPLIPSPSSSSVFGASQSGTYAPGTSIQNSHPGPFTDWIGLSPGKTSMAEQLRGANPSTGFDPMMSRMSYSSAAAAPRPPLSQAPSGQGPPGIPPPATRVPSGKGWAHGGTPLSPLSGPVLTGDDDDLFSMDG
ncbi:hypothetical protein OF83DRAFT_1054251 [Amylostereum chailletii]|nr:hypothetical protein OF83DRAFT_1054251 [Amylostereum chailletii]